MESALRPRDIQSRIRAGESPEDVAAVAGTAVEKVMIFASPVLAERAHVAASAESASVRRSTPDPTSPAVATTRTLGAAVACRLREQGVDPAGVEWDSWRREDGRWTLQAGYLHDDGERRGRFSFDQRGHFVTADDDEARWLVGDGQVPARVADAAPSGPPGLRLAPSYAEPEPEPTPAAPAAPAAPDSAAVTPAAAARRAEGLGDDTLDLFTAEADWMASLEREPVTATTTPDPNASDPETEPGDPVVDPAAPVDEPTPQQLADDGARSEDTVETPRPKPAPRKARGRASVPSWDEIMFGGGK